MTCTERTLVDAHFAGTIAPRDERRLRAHLDGCAACRARYRKRQLLGQIDPQAFVAEERIGRGLGLRRAPRVSHLPLVAAALAFAALVFFVIRPAPKDDGFTPRGAPPSIPTTSASPSPSTTISSIAVYRASADSGAIALAGGSVRGDDELAFSYDNSSRKRYLMIFGVDETGRVYWFYPAWTRELDDPSSIPIEPGRRAELPDAVRHPFAGGHLAIHGLFLDAPRTVREVEAALAEAEGGLLEDGMPGAVDHVTMLEVTR